MTHDPYALENAFDDYFVGGGVVVAPPVDLDRAARKIVHHVGRRRVALPMRVLGASADTTLDTFAAPYSIGEDDRTGLPLFDAMQDHFTIAPKLVRVDDAASYNEFRIARMEKRLAALEAAVAAHVADDHGGGKLAALEDAFEAHIAQAVHGDTIPMPPGIDAWRDGGEILCTVRTMAPEGLVAVTTGIPLATAVDEVVVGAMAGKVEPEAVYSLAPVLACVLGAGGLVPQICRAMPELLGCHERTGSFIGVLASGVDSRHAAAMLLVQRCQQGDKRACVEAAALMGARSGRKLLKSAAKRLERGQREAAGRHS